MLVELIPFEQFVKSKDPDEKIWHDTWHSCAVGEWVELNQVHFDHEDVAQTTCIAETAKYKVPQESADDFEIFDETWYGNYVSLGDILNVALQMDGMESLNYPVGTYGELAILIDACEYIE